jgi:hypothetical protein
MSDLSLSQHTALAFLLSQHTSEQSAHDAQKSETVVIRNADPKVKGGKKGATSSKGEQAAPIHDGPKVFGVTMPERNTLDAKSFLRAMLDAGKRRNDKGFPYTDPKEVRNDQIKAVHAFVGYDTHRDFGSQEIEARAKAQRDLKGYKVTGPTREEQRAASRSMTGFIAGLPDHKARRLQDLMARETAAVDAMLEHMKASRDPKRSRVECLQSQGLAEVERERLSAIRHDIMTFG